MHPLMRLSFTLLALGAMGSAPTLAEVEQMLVGEFVAAP